MELSSFTGVMPIYIALLGLVFIAITMRVGMYRGESKIFIGDGGDPEMLRRMRGQANFVETVPIALFLLITMEALGASDTWMHALGIALVTGRIAHYLGLSELAPIAFRVVGMLATILTIAVSAIWILVKVL